MTPRGAAPRTGRLRTVLLLGSLEAFGPLSMDLYMPALPELAKALNTTDALAQATMSLCMIGLGIGQLILGPLSDRFGRRVPLLTGIGLFALLSVVCAFAPSIEVLLAARLLQGLAASAGVVVSIAIARDMYEGAELSRMLSLLMLVGATAPILAPIAGGALVLIVDWRGLFGVLALIGAALFVAAWRGVPHGASTRTSGGLTDALRQFRHVLSDRVFVLIVITAGCTGVAFFSYLSMSTFVLQDEFGLTPQAFSLVFAANGLANMLGAQASRAAVRRTGPAGMYLIGITATAVCTALLLMTVVLDAPVPLFLAALCATLLCAGVSGPNSTALALSRHADRAGTAASLIGTGTFVVGPIVAPLASAGGATALTMAVTMSAAAVLGAASAWLFVRPALRARGDVGDA